MLADNLPGFLLDHRPPHGRIDLRELCSVAKMDLQKLDRLLRCEGAFRREPKSALADSETTIRHPWSPRLINRAAKKISRSYKSRGAACVFHRPLEPFTVAPAWH